MPPPRKQRFDAKQEGRDLYGKHTVFGSSSSSARTRGRLKAVIWGSNVFILSEAHALVLVEAVSHQG